MRDPSSAAARGTRVRACCCVPGVLLVTKSCQVGHQCMGWFGCRSLSTVLTFSFTTTVSGVSPDILHSSAAFVWSRLNFWELFLVFCMLLLLCSIPFLFHGSNIFAFFFFCYDYWTWGHPSSLSFNILSYCINYYCQHFPLFSFVCIISFFPGPFVILLFWSSMLFHCIYLFVCVWACMFL